MKITRCAAALFAASAAVVALTGCTDYNTACRTLASPTASERAALAGGAEVEREVPASRGASTMIDCELTPAGTWQRESES